MTTKTPLADRTLVACDECLRQLPRSEAFVPEGVDYVAHFCGLDCYAAWRSRLASEEQRNAPAARPEPPADAPQPEAQEGHRDHGPGRDERIKRAIRRHPQREEPKIEGVEPWELPPR